MTLRHGERSHAAVIEPSCAPRRVFSAFILGAALSVAGLAALAAGVAGAHGLFVPPNLAVAASAPERISIMRYQASAPSRRRNVADDEDSHKRRHRLSLRASLVGLGAFPGGHDPVCVRLCDGFFFPLPTAASDVVSQGSACNSLCPDAPTEVFYRNGGEIEGSVSPAGKPYSALPVSLRYRARANDTCSCHREAIAYAPLKDATLKQGDAIMTPAGFVVFRGVEGAPHRAADFSALVAAGLSRSATAPLQEMERASVASVHPTLQDWLAAQNTPALAYRPASGQVALHAEAARPAPVAGGSGGKIYLLSWHGRDE